MKPKLGPLPSSLPGFVGYTKHRLYFNNFQKPAGENIRVHVDYVGLFSTTSFINIFFYYYFDNQPFLWISPPPNSRLLLQPLRKSNLGKKRKFRPPTRSLSNFIYTVTSRKILDQLPFCSA